MLPIIVMLVYCYHHAIIIMLVYCHHHAIILMLVYCYHHAIIIMLVYCYHLSDASDDVPVLSLSREWGSHPFPCCLYRIRFLAAVSCRADEA